MYTLERNHLCYIRQIWIFKKSTDEKIDAFKYTISLNLIWINICRNYFKNKHANTKTDSQVCGSTFSQNINIQTLLLLLWNRIFTALFCVVLDKTVLICLNFSDKILKLQLKYKIWKPITKKNIKFIMLNLCISVKKFWRRIQASVWKLLELLFNIQMKKIVFIFKNLVNMNFD